MLAIGRSKIILLDFFRPRIELMISWVFIRSFQDDMQDRCDDISGSAVTQNETEANWMCMKASEWSIDRFISQRSCASDRWSYAEHIQIYFLRRNYTFSVSDEMINKHFKSNKIRCLSSNFQMRQKNTQNCNDCYNIRRSFFRRRLTQMVWSLCHMVAGWRNFDFASCVMLFKEILFCQEF